MRYKNTETMEKIVKFANEYHRQFGKSPSTTEIANEVGLARGTAYTYLVAMRDRGMIEYDGKNIITNLFSLVNHEHNNAPIVGRVVCGDAVEEEEMVKEYMGINAITN